MGMYFICRMTLRLGDDPLIEINLREKGIGIGKSVMDTGDI
jgi:hypothetical protein